MRMIKYVMTVAQETVKAAYSEAGQPDAYEEDSVFYITSMQFAFVAAVSGIMLREKPATNFYMGSFFAESLFLAERLPSRTRPKKRLSCAAII